MLIIKTLGRISRSIIFIVIAIAMMGSIVTFWAFRSAVNSSEKAIKDPAMQRVETLEKFLDERLISYEGILKGGAGLFDASSGTITQNQWRLFAEAYHFSQQFPAVEALGFVEAQGVVLYTEPRVVTDPIGYNMLSNPLKAQTLNQARESGEISISPILTLNNTPDKAFLVVYPLYSRPDLPPILKKDNLAGYVYLTINVNKLFAVVIQKSLLENLEFAVSEGDDLGSKDYIYRSSGFGQKDNQEVISQPINVHKQNWVIHSNVDEATHAYKTTRSQPYIVALVGVVATLILSVSLGQALRNRSRQIEDSKELELKESKDELLSLASHQLRTPSTAVKHYTGMLLQGYGGKIDKKQREFLNRAYNANERQLEIINQILHVSRIETGSLELAIQQVNITRITKTFILEYKKQLKDKKQKVKLNIEDKLPEIQCDPIYLTIIIENLLTNASKYTPDGGKISIQLYTDSSCFILEVSDNGVGIDKKDLGQLFKKFSRIHNDLSIRSGGSGIGLYLSKLIVELHGGTIEIISRKGIGSTFRVKLPITTEKKL